MRTTGQGTSPVNPVLPSGSESEATPMGRVSSVRIDLGSGRQVCRSDLFVLHALVSGNEQTLQDLSQLKVDEQIRIDRQIRRSRSRLGREPLLDRINTFLGETIRNHWYAVRSLLLTARHGPLARSLGRLWRDAWDLPGPSAVPHASATPRKAGARKASSRATPRAAAQRRRAA